MSFGKIRRLLSFVLALVLTAGLVGYGVGGPNGVVQSVAASANGKAMSAEMMAISNEAAMPADMAISKGTPMRGKCNGCAGDDKGIASGACSALCGTVIPSLAVVPVLYAVPVELLNPMSEARVVGHSYPPDPHPPRTTILS